MILRYPVSLSRHTPPQGAEPMLDSCFSRTIQAIIFSHIGHVFPLQRLENYSDFVGLKPVLSLFSNLNGQKSGTFDPIDTEIDIHI